MAKGTVKWFNNQKGYGFVCEQDKDEEIFAHFSSIVMDGYKSLKAGQEVVFEINRGPKGLHALNIQPSDSKSNSHASERETDQVAS
jgi:CspA family cold shock protein